MLVGHVISISTEDTWLEFSKSICDYLIISIANKKCLLPSALMDSLHDQVEKILCNFVLCDTFLDIIGLGDMFHIDLLSQFMTEFCLNYSKQIFMFISKTFRGNIPPRPMKQTAEPDLEERQVIYYIAGSIMKGYFRIAKRFKNNKKWQEIALVIQTKVLVDKPVGDVDLSVEAAWTMAVDRGGLLFVSAQSQVFFVKLTKVIYDNEKHDGIDYDDIINKVCNSNISVDWDNIISDSLREDVSVKLMCDVVQCLCKTCGRGFAKRRLNSLRNKPLISMPTRHLVARRKKK